MRTLFELFVLGTGTVALFIGLNLLMMASSYWKYFLPMMPVLAVYGALAAFGFHYCIAPGWYMWHPILISIFCYGTLQQAREQYAAIAGSGPLEKKSARRTLIFLALSMFLYLASFLGAVFWLHNESVVREILGL